MREPVAEMLMDGREHGTVPCHVDHHSTAFRRQRLGRVVGQDVVVPTELPDELRVRGARDADDRAESTLGRALGKPDGRLR